MGNKWLDRVLVQTGIKSDASKIIGPNAEYFKMLEASNRGAKYYFGMPMQVMQGKPKEVFTQVINNAFPAGTIDVDGVVKQMGAADADARRLGATALPAHATRVHSCHGKCTATRDDGLSRPWGAIVAFLLPALTIYVAFTAYPVVRTLWNSFHKVLPRREVFVGLENYAALAQDEIFWRVGAQHHHLGVDLAARRGLGGADPGARALRQGAGRALLPHRLVHAGADVLHRRRHPVGLDLQFRLGSGERGAAGDRARGLAKAWLGDPNTALPSLIVVTTWMWTGFNMVVLLAALHSLPKEVIEAAELDNCGWGQKLFFVILPLIWPTVLNLVVLSFIGKMKIFDLVWITTKGGPLWSTETVSTYVYKRAFEWSTFDLGYPSTIATVWFVIVLATVLTLTSRCASAASSSIETAWRAGQTRAAADPALRLYGVRGRTVRVGGADVVAHDDRDHGRSFRPAAILHWDKFPTAWFNSNYSVYFTNSAMIVLSAVLILTVVGAMAAHCLARYRFRLNRVIYFILFSTIIFPPQITIISLFQILVQYGLYDTSVGLTFVYVAIQLPLTIYILESFFARIPTDLFDAARMDGYSEWEIFWRSACRSRSRPSRPR